MLLLCTMCSCGSLHSLCLDNQLVVSTNQLWVLMQLDLHENSEIRHFVQVVVKTPSTEFLVIP